MNIRKITINHKTEFIVFCCLTILVSACVADNLKSMEFRWSFPENQTMTYNLEQKAQIQYYRHDPNLEQPVKSPVSEEFTSGTATFRTLPDRNSYGEMMLQLLDIRQNGKSIEVPARQKIPQKVCKFIMTESSEMEQYSGPQKETYVLTRLLFGLPLKPLQQNQVRVYPFNLVTNRDEAVSPMTGRISHELTDIVELNGQSCARINTTIDLVDQNPAENIQTSSWKGTSEAVFNIDMKRWETVEWKIALKKQMIPQKEDDPTMIIEIFDIKANFAKTE